MGTKKKTKSTIFHDNIAEIYESQYYTPYWRFYHEITWQNLIKYLPENRSAVILDAGGGTRFWARKLTKLGFKILCTDVAQKMLDVGIEQAKKEKLNDRIEIKYADIINMECFKNNSFDMVVALGDAIAYCENPKKALKELSRVARGGLTYVL